MQIGSLLSLWLGHWLSRKGLTALAESTYRSSFEGSGKLSAEAGFRLSQLLLDQDRDRDALVVCEEALRAAPEHAGLWCALGAAQRRLARMDLARDAFEKAVALAPRHAHAWNNLGEWWLIKGEATTALEKLEQALRLEPQLLQALNNRVAALYESGRFREAESAARKAIELHPNEAALHVNLGNVLLHTGKARLAVKSFQKALESDPSRSEAQLGLATILGETHRLAETLDFIEHEIAVKGESVQRLASLALAQQAKGDLSTAEATCRKVLGMQPNNISVLITLAGCMSVKGAHQEAIRLHERALVENPNMPAIYSNVAFDATYLPDISANEVFAYHREWADRFEKTNEKQAFSHEQSRDADRPLRIGYVSGDFGRHPVGFLLRDVMRNHDRKQVEIYCYSMMRASDDVTETIRSHSDAWIDALLMSDDELAEQIHQDQIDILVDLSGHTAYNRLPAFVRRPAPVQATWIGYFHSTGLKNIDYFITDPVTTPADAGQLFSEIPVWLPHSRFCYSAPEYAPSVAPSPVLDVGYITFGSFNRVEKLVDPVISAWIRILDAVPGSRLLLKAGVLENESVRDSLRRRFVELGLQGDRLELRGPSQHPDMLAQYGEVDIALDPFPFNGGMTTLEALWMGVPVVTLAGNSVVSRQSASALTNIGLSELVFDDLNMYIEGAISLAHNVERLTALRPQIRRRMENSPLCQPAQFTQDLEALYGRMWKSWCDGKKLGTEVVQAPYSRKSTMMHVASRAGDAKKIRLICATRLAQDGFFKSTALGRSFSLYKDFLPFVELQLFSENSEGLPTIYNTAIEHAEKDPATLVFIHDDVYLPDFSWTNQIHEALKNFDIVGVAGNKRRLSRQPAWAFIDESFTWDEAKNLSGTVGHGTGFPCDQIDRFGPSPQECKLLDGVMLVADSATLIEHQLRFDPKFNFHFYDLDFCRQAELKNLRMGTWPITLVHESIGAFGSESWRAAFDIYLKKYGE